MHVRKYYVRIFDLCATVAKYYSVLQTHYIVRIRVVTLENN